MLAITLPEPTPFGLFVDEFCSKCDVINVRTPFVLLIFVINKTGDFYDFLVSKALGIKAVDQKEVKPKESNGMNSLFTCCQ